MADTTAPTLTSLVIPTTIDLSKGNAPLTISTIANDPSGIRQVVIYFDHTLSYSYSYSETATSNAAYNFVINSGSYDSWSDGQSTQTWGVMPYNSGVYNVTSVDVTDNQQNRAVYSGSQLTSMGFNTSITTVGGAELDTTPPVLTSLIVPTTIDLSKGNAPLTISTIANDPSGIQQVVIYFDHTLSYSYSYSETATSNAAYNFVINSGSYDSWTDGQSTQTWGVMPYNSGIYKHYEYYYCG